MVICTAKRRNGINEVKPVKNINENLKRFLETSCTLVNSCRDTHAQFGTKTTQFFISPDGEALWSLLPSLVFLSSGSTVEPGNTYSCVLKVKSKA